MRDFFNENGTNEYFCGEIPYKQRMISIFDDMSQMTEDEVQRMLPLVDGLRREQALRYKHVFGQFACLKSWIMLQEMLEPLKIKDLKIAYNEHGKPYFVHHPNVHFNLSHCKNGIAVVVDNAPVGIDIESFHPENEAIFRRTMNDTEIEAIHSADCPSAAFTQLWTMKEAVVKLRGTGIIDDLHGILDGKGYRLESHINHEKQYAWTVAYTQ